MRHYPAGCRNVTKATGGLPEYVMSWCSSRHLHAMNHVLTHMTGVNFHAMLLCELVTED